MATRMVAQLNRRGIARANLQDLFSHSTLSNFCAHLQAATSGEDNPIPLCQGDGEETLFVFHASDGDISAWLPLASALNRRVFGLQAKSPQRFATLDQMIDEYVGCIRRQQPHGPYVLAGWSYGAFLAAGAAQRLYAKGEQVRMVLIDPVCRQDFMLRKPGGPAAPVSRRTNASGTARTFRPADARQPACRLYQPR